LVCALLFSGAYAQAAAVAATTAVNKARPPEPLDPQKTLAELNNPDPNARTEAVEKFSLSLANTFGAGPGSVKVEDHNDALLPVLLKAITDDDPGVRRQGFGALNVVAHVNIAARFRTGGFVSAPNLPIDLAREPRLKSEIVRHLDDPSWEVRKFAIYALGYGYPPAEGTEKLLLDRWKAESARPINKPSERIDTDEVRQAISEGLRAG